MLLFCLVLFWLHHAIHKWHSAFWQPPTSGLCLLWPKEGVWQCASSCFTKHTLLSAPSRPPILLVFPQAAPLESRPSWLCISMVACSLRVPQGSILGPMFLCCILILSTIKRLNLTGLCRRHSALQTSKLSLCHAGAPRWCGSHLWMDFLEPPHHKHG